MSVKKEHEAALLKKIAEGDRTAFNQFFDRYKDRLCGFLYKVTKSYELSEEIAMDVFMKLWTGRALLPKVVNLDGFLFKVAYNKAMDFLRKVSRRERLQQFYIDRMEDEAQKQPDELLLEEEVRALFAEAVDSLSPQRKLIYKLSREESLTYDQIAETLGLSPHTVKNSIISARKSILAFLKDSDLGEAALSLLILFFIK